MKISLDLDICLNTEVSAQSDLVLLKLFVPPYYYEAYMVFLAGGEPIGIIDKEGAQLIERANGVKLSELLKDSNGVQQPNKLEQIKQLLEAGLLVFSKNTPTLHWIAPDKSTGTRHSGKGAELFINYFYDYFGSVFYEGSPLIDSHQEFLDILIRYFPHEGGKICLDAGSGSGYYSAALASLGHHVYACDINITRLNASVNQAYTLGKIEGVQCNIENIPLSDESIDFAMCNFVLEHVADPYAVVEELIRLLRPNGGLLLSVPSFNVRDNLATWMHGELPTLNFEHLRSYGLINGTHPWCEPILDTIKHLNENGIEVEIVEGINILTGLWEPWETFLNEIANQIGSSFSTTWPWNCMGQQTVIFGRRQSCK